MARIDDIRRFFLSLSLFLLFISLIGNEMPWLKFHQKNNTEPHSLLMLNTTQNITYTCSSNINTVRFNIDIYFNLINTQVCNKFEDGYLPYYIGGANLKNIEMCTKLSYKDLSNFMIKTNDWNEYSKKCKHNGGLSFTLILFGILLILISIIINTFPKQTIQKCFNDSLSRNAKIIRLLIGLLSTVFILIALILFGVGCVQNKEIKSLIQSQGFKRIGYWGFFFAAVGFICNILWMIFFIIKMRGNQLPQIDTTNANDLVKKLVPDQLQKKDSTVADDYVHETYNNDDDITTNNEDSNDNGYVHETYNDDVSQTT